MNEEQQPVAAAAKPTCYKHPSRETRLSCGRCGRPLCPDCVRHGPVGIRCEECLRPPKVEVTLAEPEKVTTALGIAIAEAVVSIAIIAALGMKLEFHTPNLLISGIASGLVGWTIWRICGKSSNRRTAWWAFAIGLAIPLLATIVMLAPQWQELIHLPLKALLLIKLRVVVAMLISGLFAWLLSTQRRGERDIF